jgi:CBS domain-containing protein
VAAADRLSGLKAGDIMRRNVLVVAETTSLVDVATFLSENRIGGAPVVNEAGHIVGVVSMKDVLERFVERPGTHVHGTHDFYDMTPADFYLDQDEAESAESFEELEEAEETARDVMTAQVHSVKLGDSIPQVAKTMVELEIHRVLVQDKGKHVGIITTFDVLKAIAE